MNLDKMIRHYVRKNTLFLIIAILLSSSCVSLNPKGSSLQLSGHVRLNIQSSTRRVSLNIAIRSISSGEIHAEVLDFTGNAIWIYESINNTGRLIDLHNHCEIKLGQIRRKSRRALGIQADGLSLFNLLKAMQADEWYLDARIWDANSISLDYEKDSVTGLYEVAIQKNNPPLNVRLRWTEIPQIGPVSDRISLKESSRIACPDETLTAIWTEFFR